MRNIPPGKIPGQRFPTLLCVRVLKIRHFGREEHIESVLYYSKNTGILTLLTIQLDRDRVKWYTGLTTVFRFRVRGIPIPPRSLSLFPPAPASCAPRLSPFPGAVHGLFVRPYFNVRARA